MEDYLTEIVATTIQRQAIEFVRWLRALHVTELPDSISISVHTHYYCPPSEENETREKYPDFLVRLGDGLAEEIIFIESKVDSDLSGKNQLQVYARILSAFSASRKTLLFITRDYYPQDHAAVLALIPPDREKPEFLQARWSHFAAHFKQCNRAANDPIVTELLDFMKNEKLTQDHQFTPADIAAITGFQHAYSVMRSVIDDELRTRLSGVCGELMDDYDTDVQVIRGPMLTLRNRPKGRNIGVTLGFWLEPDDQGYPWIYGDIWFDAKTQDKAKVVQAMLEFVSRKSNEWRAEDLSEASSYGRVFRECSLAAFLAEPNHASAIKKFLFEIIDDIGEFKKAYPKLAWTK